MVSCQGQLIFKVSSARFSTAIPLIFPTRTMYKPRLGTSSRALTSLPRRSFCASTLLEESQRLPPWRSGSALDSWAEREIRPCSLRQLTFFGRTLTEGRLLASANYVRTELPTRIAHRLRDMQRLPYVVVTNPHMSLVYELYYAAFERFRKVPEIRTLEDNDKYCEILSRTLREHLVVISNLMMGVIECEDLVDADEMDRFMNSLLRARISRRVIAEQHLSLTKTLKQSNHFRDIRWRSPYPDAIGEVLLKCSAKDVIEKCSNLTREFLRRATDSPPNCVPDVSIKGHLDTTFPYTQSHLEYIIGELLRNSIYAVTRRYGARKEAPPKIEVVICEAPQHVTIRISDQGGGIPREFLPNLWSFCKGPRNQLRLQNLQKVPTMAATLQELQLSDTGLPKTNESSNSLSSLTSRSPHLTLGMGLPMSRVYAEYWAGSLEVHSLEGYGVDAFLQLSKLGNKNEQLTARASIDAV